MFWIIKRIVEKIVVHQMRIREPFHGIISNISKDGTIVIWCQGRYITVYVSVADNLEIYNKLKVDDRIYRNGGSVYIWRGEKD